MTHLPREFKEGWTEFLGARIDLSKRPMIPRPETEFWVNEFADVLNDQVTSSRNPVSIGYRVSVLDMFTGSGCIGIALALKFPDINFTLSDIKNYISTPLPPNITFIESNLFENIVGKYDYILANPPYVAEGTGVDGIMQHEPKDALYAGPDGLDVIRPFISQSASHLNLDGQLWMEFSPEQKNKIEKMIPSLSYPKPEFHKDQYDRWRYVVVKK